MKFQTVVDTNKRTRGGLLLIVALLVTLSVVAYTKYATYTAEMQAPEFTTTAQTAPDGANTPLQDTTYQAKDFGPSIASQKLIQRARELSTEYDVCMGEGWVIYTMDIDVCNEDGCTVEKVNVRQVRRPEDCRALFTELQSMGVESNECEGTPDGELCTID